MYSKNEYATSAQNQEKIPPELLSAHTAAAFPATTLLTPLPTKLKLCEVEFH